MNIEYINIYNNLVNLSRNKTLFSYFTKKDTYSDRLIIFLIHLAFFLKKFRKITDQKYLQDFYTIDDINDLKFDTKRSETFKKTNFIYNFLSSMRQRINDPLGVRKKKRRSGE